MNTPEFRLLSIWQNVVELEKVQLKMPAYRKIASRVGISERNVRENIKKLVELGYLVEKDSWYAINFDCEFIKFVVEKHARQVYTTKEPTEGTVLVKEPSVRFQFVHSPSYEVILSNETLNKLNQDFGKDSIEAVRFIKEKILKNI